MRGLLSQPRKLFVLLSLSVCLCVSVCVFEHGSMSMCGLEFCASLCVYIVCVCECVCVRVSSI